MLGTAGVGKSSLTAEFLAELPDARVVSGRCLSYGEGITYWPVVEILKQLLGASPAAVLDEFALDDTASASLLGLLGEAEQPESPEIVAWSFRTLLEAVAEATPLVVVLDDLQWAEPTLLDLVEHVADLSRDAPILLLCLARPDLLDRRPGWGGGKLNATTALLAPLPADDASASSTPCSRPGTRRRGATRIVSAADGNPLFVEEMLALIRERGTGTAACACRRRSRRSWQRASTSSTPPSAACWSGARWRGRSSTAAPSRRSPGGVRGRRRGSSRSCARSSSARTGRSCRATTRTASATC